jgi:sec-independent protein translocase protein TatA
VFGLGGTELLILFVVILLVFGPSQIPKMARGLGQAMREFRKAQREISDEMKAEDDSSGKPPQNRPTG